MLETNETNSDPAIAKRVKSAHYAGYPRITNLPKSSCKSRRYGRASKVCKRQPATGEKRRRNGNSSYEPPVSLRIRKGKDPENRVCNTRRTQTEQASMAYGEYGTNREQVISSETRASAWCKGHTGRGRIADMSSANHVSVRK